MSKPHRLNLSLPTPNSHYGTLDQEQQRLRGELPLAIGAAARRQLGAGAPPRVRRVSGNAPSTSHDVCTCTYGGTYDTRSAF